MRTMSRGFHAGSACAAELPSGCDGRAPPFVVGPRLVYYVVLIYNPALSVAARVLARGFLPIIETTMMNFLKSLLFGSGHDLGPDDAMSAIHAGALEIDAGDLHQFASVAI